MTKGPDAKIPSSGKGENRRDSYCVDYRPLKPVLTARDYQAWAEATFFRVKGWLPAAGSTPILDLGCGPGYFLYLLGKLGYTNLTGVDSSPGQITWARQFCPHARIIQDDLRQVLQDNPNTYGLISGFDVIEHFRKEEVIPLVHLLARALQPGGRVILQTPNAESPWVGNVAYGDLTHEWLFTPASLADLLGRAGLGQFAARPCGPYVHGFKSFGRVALWNMLNLWMTLRNLIEIGHNSSGIFTRVFLATAVKE